MDGAVYCWSYTRAFLEYARTHWIKVVGYPSHSTHIYQDLNVVIFAPMKHNWSLVHDEWEQKGHTVDKTNFLSVYAEAHSKTLTPSNIKAAFRATGVIPFNPDVVTEEKMAPSLETSIQATVPIRQSSPIEKMSEMVLDYMDYRRIMALSMNTALSTDDTGALPGPSTPLTDPSSTPTPLFVHSAVDALASTSAAFLASPSPIKSSSAPPTFKTSNISPSKHRRHGDLLVKPVHTIHEQDLRDALIEAETRDAMRKEQMVGMQAGIVLANLYASRVQGQLQAAEERKQKKGKRLMGDGKAKLFSGEEFYALCVEEEQRRAQEEAAAEQR
jgi:hypothetical protein